MASSSFNFMVFVLYSTLSIYSAQQHQQRQDCPLFSCRSFSQIGFPFINTSSSDCGSVVLNCSDNGFYNTKVQFQKQQRWYSVASMSYSDKSILIRDLDLQIQLDNNSCDSLTNFTVPVSPSVKFDVVSPSFTFFKCKRDKTSPDSQQDFFQSLQNYTGCIDNYDLYFTENYNTSLSLPPLPEPLLNSCSIVQLPSQQLHYSSKRAYRVHQVTAVEESGGHSIQYGALRPSARGCSKFTYCRKDTVTASPGPAASRSQGSKTTVTASRPAASPGTAASRSRGSNITASPGPAASRSQGSNTTVTASPTQETRPGLNSSEGVKNLSSLVTAEYSLNWEILPACSECEVKGGFCLEDANGSFQCGGLKGGNGNGRRKKIIIGLPIFISVFMLIVAIVYYCSRKRYLTANSVVFWKRTKNVQLFEDFFQNYESMTPKRFSYSDIKRMTESFKDKLGQGGYGGVFKGKLRDGCLVAVKVLTESKGNGEEFINEVASISKTSHVNIVSLLGFCSERSKRALVYEFMPNGSLDKFIYSNNSSSSRSTLDMEMLYEIAIGIARGLEYLHRGCSTRIVHFDIKPHNILLDQSFCPKISDFGLAKLCPREDSIMSMIGARGTVGYIAPELVCVNYGGVSHKSDVYSYGMMVLEMVGGRRNIDAEADRTSEIYFPYWIYHHLEQDGALRLQGVVSEAQRCVARKMILVGLWCIQTKPSDRPSINRVLEMLEGSLESLETPPKPFLFSPERSPADSSSTK